MANNHPKKRRRARRKRRVLLVVLLLMCLAGAGYLVYLGATELREHQQGADFYTRLSESMDEQPAATGTPTPEPTASPTPKPTVGETQEPLPEPTEETVVWQPAITLQPVVEADPEPTAVPNLSEMDFEALWQTCPDVVGWIRLEDSVIDYPVVLGEDNDFYLHHLADGTENRAGCIMMDEANSGDFKDDVTILHGHHMRTGAMFGRLADYKKEAYYQTHKIIRLYTPAGDCDVEVFAAYTVNGYTFGYPTSFEDETDFDAFLRRAVSSTPYETDVEVAYGDHLLMLSTCAYSYEGARFVVVGKILDGEEGEITAR